MKIADNLIKDVELATPNMPIRDAALKMKERDCGSIPVADGDTLIGMITDRDITIRAVAEGRDPMATTCQDVMSPNILYCFDDQDVEEVVRNMADQKVRRLPVLNRDKRLVGIVSLGDLSVSCDDEKLCGEALEKIRKAA